MDSLELLIDLHRDGPRQGPGSDGSTGRALDLSGLRDRTGLRIADIGCGTGATTRLLARDLDAHVTAVDMLPPFLAVLEAAATAAGLSARIEPLAADMADLPFADGSFDAIWSEGAVYNIGFARGVAAWRRFLRPGGVLAVSDLTWLTTDRPAALTDHWMAEYPEVDTAGAKMAVLERARYTPLGYFPLPPADWLEGYYRPMQARFPAFLDRQGGSDAARALVAAEDAERALFEAHSAHVSYGFYIARRTDG